MATDKQILKVYDENKLKNEMVGSLEFSFKQIVANGSGENGILIWKNLYGSPIGCSGENTDMMNEDNEMASNWKGRILMHISCADAKNPELREKVPIDSEVMKKALAQGAFA